MCSRVSHSLVALLEHHYTGYLQRLVDHFDHGEGNYRDRLLAY
jgi:TetR/AcrR family transcriptional repressor of nem operon